MRGFRSRTRLLIDLSLVLFIAVGGTMVLAQLDAFEWLYRRSRPFDHYDLDEIVVFLSLFLSGGLLWFSVRRTREAEREIAERRRVEGLLNQLNAELEQRVEQRTDRLQKELMERKRTEERLMAYQRRLRSLSSELTLAEERERRRIAGYLHDNLGQALALAKNKLDHLKGSLPRNQAGEFEEARGLIEGLIGHTRSLIFEVSPPLLESLPYAASVELLAENILEKNGIPFKLEVEEIPLPLAGDVRVLVFKAIRELLVNIVKHARAHQVEIFMGTEGNAMVVEIIDDGIGFKVSADLIPPAGRQGFGLFSVRERLTYLNGRCMVRSKPGKGTSIRMVVPLPKSQGEKTS